MAHLEVIQMQAEVSQRDREETITAAGEKVNEKGSI
jgi:hypothetical protein